MSRRDPEGDELWSRVARSVRPLAKGHPLLTRSAPAPRPETKPPRIPAPPPKPKGPAPRATPPTLPSRPDPSTREPKPLEPNMLRRIARGRTAIEGRIDLHGLTREEAHRRLHDFLALSRAIGRRTVLVITGKGTQGRGVLRREVPQWLATGEFRAMIAGVEAADRRHGGDGALYIRLRRA